VVVDVRAPADTIFKALANFENYQSMIPTVRNVDVLSITEKSGTEVRTTTFIGLDARSHN
jgi:ribosome-associated toxin RatA of RatAB toxin-antitoxin module